jgi:hypothetical protein
LRAFHCIASLWLASCASSAAGPIGAAVLTSAVAAAVGSARVAAGTCFTVCPIGTKCNETTAMCEEIPCRGRCSWNELCDESGLLPKCVSKRQVDMQIDTRPPSAGEPVTPQ